MTSSSVDSYDSKSNHSEGSSVAADMESTSGDSSPSDSKDSAKSIQDQLSKRETAAVFRLRLLVFLVLLITAVGVSLVVFYITQAAETEELKQQYDGATEKIIESFEAIVHRMSAVSGLGVAFTAYSEENNSQWPFITMANFQQRAANARSLSGSLYVSISPRLRFSQLEQWDEYVNGPANHWIEDGLAYQEAKGVGDYENEDRVFMSMLSSGNYTTVTGTLYHDSSDDVDPLHYFDDEGMPMIENGTGPFLPIWQTSPTLKTRYVNENMFRRTNVTDEVSKVLQTASTVLGGFLYAPPGNPSHSNPRTGFFATLRSIAEKREVSHDGDPMAYLYFPVFDMFNTSERSAVAVMTSVIHWRSYFLNLLPQNIQGIRVVVDNSCDGYFTYELNGAEADVVGYGDHHDPAFNSWEREGFFRADVLDDGTVTGITFNQETCNYSIHIYPSQRFVDVFTTKSPLIITLSITAVFCFTTLMFIIYDRLVERRQGIVLAKATQSTAIVSSLFPKQVRDRLLQTDKDGGFTLATKSRLKGFLNGEDNEDESAETIADLFPHCTVFFSDISGFTAWSSTREPAQVFILLQSVYHAFDVLAKRRRVFKVETIGDSYMAVTGLPEPQTNHYITMVRFSWECILRMHQVTKQLECSLGPDTSDLKLRIGLHSGPVTAGVLRGDRARFQLFGDTVNTASRMESTGIAGKVQISSTTAKLLREAGKEHWLTVRDDSVVAKGKGVLQTFWANPTQSKGSSVTSDSSTGSKLSLSKENLASLQPSISSSVNTRLVDWMVDLMMEDVKKVVFLRKPSRDKKSTSPTYHAPEGTTCMDEVKNIIKMPAFDAEAAQCNMAEAKNVQIAPAVVDLLKEYVTIIASMYRKNPFHNFEHACHVTMSVKKLLKRIVAPELTESQIEKLKGKGQKDLASHLHDYTHGITSDPLLSLAINFSALIHDVDHRGVSNMQLALEAPEMATLYRGKSIAEQNSLDIAWDVLTQDRFDELRSFLFGTESELLRFRQLIVNVVLATDIFDKELNDLRKSRWNKAFHSTDAEKAATSSEDKGNMRATIVIEHIIQASDVSHTMQHWHVYQKWNRCLFTEMYTAYRAGRMGKDPSEFWYNGEMGFFDNYIIPLAKKLKDCGVFGVSSDEYLNYAEKNRAEWEERGEEMVREMVEKLTAEFDAKEAKAKAAEEKPMDRSAEKLGDSSSTKDSSLPSVDSLERRNSQGKVMAA